MLGILLRNHLMKRKKNFLKFSYPNDSIAGNEIPSMRNIDGKALSGASTKADATFKKITLNNINTINKVM